MKAMNLPCFHMLFTSFCVPESIKHAQQRMNSQPRLDEDPPHDFRILRTLPLTGPQGEDGVVLARMYLASPLQS